jgi:hypothetical protein
MSNQSGFTKGVWSQSHREQSDGMYITQVYDDKGQSICDLNWHSVDEGNGFKTDLEQNAQLIAAAPEMYKLLEFIASAPLAAPHKAVEIKKLLAKARGE